MKKQLAITFVLCFYSILSFSTGNNPQSNSADLDVNEPKSPTTGALLKYLDFSSSGNSGAPDISIPIYEIKAGALSLPISINYNSTGIKVADEAGNIGLNWNLIVGGIISRSVVGKPDDNSYYNDVYPSLSDPAYSMTGNPNDFDVAHGIGMGAYDGCPDLYSYNLPGSESGKFVNIPNYGIRLLPQKDILIEETTPNSDNPQVNNYKITSANGTQYFYETLERTVSSNGTTVTTTGFTWYLSRIVSFDNTEVITFNYSDTYFDILSSPGESVVLVENSCNANNLPPGTGSFQYFNTNVTIHGKQITSIDFRNGSVQFVLSQNRQDLVSSAPGFVNPKVDYIVVKNSENIETEKVHFIYNYYNPQSTASSMKRLRLDELEFIGCISCGTHQSYSYKFEYNSINLPEKLSKRIDHWGYFNNRSNSTIIPTYPIGSNLSDRCPLQTTGGQDYIGGNREVDPNYSKAGILEKITYPTGGFCRFNYESNEKDPTTEVDYSHEYVQASVISSSPNGEFEVATSPYTIQIPVSNLTINGVCAVARINYIPGTTDPSILNHWKPFVQIFEEEPISGTTNLIETINFTSSQIVADFSFTMHQGFTYYIELNTQLNGSRLNGSIMYNLPFQVTERHYVGGLRLASKEIFEATTSTPIVNTFQYFNGYCRTPNYLTTTRIHGFTEGICGGDATCSMGVAIDETHGYTIGESIQRQIVLSSTFRCPEVNMQYQQIKTFYGATGENGSVLNTFDLVNNYLPEDSKEFWKSGLLLSSDIYNSMGNLVKRSEFSYVSDNSRSERFNGLTIGSVNLSMCFLNPLDPTQFAMYSGGVCFNSLESHQINSEFFYQNLKTEYIYDENGDNPITNIEEYFYDNLDHMQISRIRTKSSRNDEIWTYLKYPKDYETSVVTDESSNSILLLKQLHLDNTVVELISTKVMVDYNEYLIGGSLSKFKRFNNIPKLSEKLTLDMNAPLMVSASDISNLSFINNSGNFMDDSKYSGKANYSMYNDFGAILNVNKPHDKTVSLEWSKTIRQPIAYFVNATYSDNVVGNECSFTSFEDNVSLNDGWGEANNNLEYHTGDASFELLPPSGTTGATGQGPLKEFLPDNQESQYRFSCWVKVPSGFTDQKATINIYSKHDSNTDNSVYPNVSGAFISIPFSSTNNEWKYIEAIIDLKEVRSQASMGSTSPKLRLRCYLENIEVSNSYYIDDIRFSPYTTIVKSFTYDKYFNQLSSTSNERSVPEFYLYNGNQSLEWVLDQNRNVLSKNEERCVVFKIARFIKKSILLSSICCCERCACNE